MLQSMILQIQLMLDARSPAISFYGEYNSVIAYFMTEKVIFDFISELHT